MENTANDMPRLVKNGAGRLIADRRQRPRGLARRRVSPVLSNIALALLDDKLARSSGGFDPYDHRQSRKGGDIWGSKRRD